ncbi:protein DETOXIFICATION 27 [Citrus sinensis]|nr:protein DETOXIFICATION 27 [Citrus sinensis]
MTMQINHNYSMFVITQAFAGHLGDLELTALSIALLGQPDDVAELSRMVSIWMAPLHFTFTFQFPLKRFLLSQLKNMVIARGTGFSLETFSGLWEFAKLSAASGVILWLPMHLRELVLENIGIDDWKFAECRDCSGCFVYLHDNKWLGNDDSSPFFASTGVRAANELGAGNGEGAKFATIISVVTSNHACLNFGTDHHCTATGNKEAEKASTLVKKWAAGTSSDCVWASDKDGLS